VTEIKDVSHHNGLSQLLDTFPLATEIIVGNGNHRLVTPPRLLVDPSHPQPSAELHVKVLLKSGAADLPLLIRVYPKLRAFDCVVVYTITIGSDCRIDWDLSMWGRMVIPGKTALASWPPEDGTPLAQSIVIPFCVIHDREIHSMTIKQSIDLETLSKHLEQRRQMGWGDIKRWDVRVTSFSALPQFLSLNRQVTELTIRRSGALPINIAGFLTLDWSPLRRTIQNPHHGLEDLTIRLDFSRACAGNIGHRIRTIMESGNRSPVFGLKTLVLLIETGTVAKKAIASLPPYSQIAKLFVGIYGHHFELKIEMAEVGAVEGPFIECLRSQLVKGGRAPTREGKEKNGIRVVMPWFT
jgi:hypothetical protein